MGRKRKEDSTGVVERVIKVNGRQVVVREGPKPTPVIEATVETKVEPVVEPVKEVKVVANTSNTTTETTSSNNVLKEIKELEEKVEELKTEVQANTDVKNT